MLRLRLRRVSKNKRALYGGMSLLVHALILGFVLNPAEDTASTSEIRIAVELPEEPLEEPLEEQAASERSRDREAAASAPAEAASASKERAAPGAGAKAARAVASEPAPLVLADLRALRANLSLASVTTSLPHDGSGETPAPIGPDVHLSEQTIERLVKRGHARDGDEGGSGGGIIAIGGDVCRP